MTKQEVKDEYKQTEGSPEVRAKIRRLQMESATKSASNKKLWKIWEKLQLSSQTQLILQ